MYAAKDASLCLLRNTHLSGAHVAVHLTVERRPNQTKERAASHWPSLSRWRALDLQTSAHWTLTWGYAKEGAEDKCEPRLQLELGPELSWMWIWESARHSYSLTISSFFGKASFISLPGRLTTASRCSDVKQKVIQREHFKAWRWKWTKETKWLDSYCNVIGSMLFSFKFSLFHRLMLFFFQRR